MLRNVEIGNVEIGFLMMVIFSISLIVQIVFILQKIFGVLTWSWWKVLCIFEFYGALWLLGVMVLAVILLTIKIMRLKYW
jgi:hypothetical protein